MDRRQAAVINEARKVVQRHPDIEDFAALKKAIEALDRCNLRHAPSPPPKW